MLASFDASYVLPIGTLTAKTPMTLDLRDVAAPGFIRAALQTEAEAGPSFLVGSGIDLSRNVNLFWRVEPTNLALSSM